MENGTIAILVLSIIITISLISVGVILHYIAMLIDLVLIRIEKTLKKWKMYLYLFTQKIKKLKF